MQQTKRAPPMMLIGGAFLFADELAERIRGVLGAQDRGLSGGIGALGVPRQGVFSRQVLI